MDAKTLSQGKAVFKTSARVPRPGGPRATDRTPIRSQEDMDLTVAEARREEP